ncbi:MAG: serine protein kinase RIO [Nitrosopumilaceae archaeon]|nr:serine protein kinase RIO [Nitrosopumilaceae archaeon]
MSYDNLSKKLESKIEKKLLSKARKKTLDDGFKKNKVVNEVLDKKTIMTLYHMINEKIIAYVNGAISAGKESVVFWAVDTHSKNIALKIYLVTTSNFKKRTPYIQGDPRFNKIKKGTRNLVHLWAQKEFRNMSQCYDSNLSVPRPISLENNVLAMDFIGTGGSPAPLLQESDVNEDDYLSAIDFIQKLYNNAKLVHGDFSEYNIFKTEKGLVFFDLGSAVDLRHPNSLIFLKRDINNITRFFSKRGISVKDPSEVFEDLIK